MFRRILAINYACAQGPALIIADKMHTARPVETFEQRWLNKIPEIRLNFLPSEGNTLQFVIVLGLLIVTQKPTNSEIKEKNKAAQFSSQVTVSSRF